MKIQNPTPANLPGFPIVPNGKYPHSESVSCQTLPAEPRDYSFNSRFCKVKAASLGVNELILRSSEYTVPPLHYVNISLLIQLGHISGIPSLLISYSRISSVSLKPDPESRSIHFAV